jgi:hypothetical protein
LTAGYGPRFVRETGNPVWLLASAASLLFVAGPWLPGASAAFERHNSSARIAGCSRVASPTGSDRARGTLRSPYRTFNRLVASLKPGMVGCLRAGSYGDRSTVEMIKRSGLPGRRIVITGYKRERPTIYGAVFVSDNADYVTLSHVAVEGANNLHPGGKPQSMEIWGDHFIFEDSTLTNRNSAISGILVQADSAMVRRNKIHDVGGNFGYDHGIYVAKSRNFTIEWNWIYDCRSGWGVQLFPNAIDGRIRHNVIDGCGSGVTISGSGSDTSRGNLVDHNLITKSVGLGRFNRGTAIAGCCASSPFGNLVAQNIFWGNVGGSFDNSVGKSYVVRDNLSVNPGYVNAAAKDFRVRSARAKRLGLWNGVPR